MKIVNFEDFTKLPDGTIYSEWNPDITSGLLQRQKVILDEDGCPIDFFYVSLKAESYNGEDPVVDAVPTRWGCFDQAQLFAVYQRNDMNTLLGILKESPLIDTCGVCQNIIDPIDNDENLNQYRAAHLWPQLPGMVNVCDHCVERRFT